MASRFDLIQVFGNKACAVANKVTSLVASSDSCAANEAWNFGALLLVGIAIVLAVRLINERRKRFRDAYFW